MTPDFKTSRVHVEPGVASAEDGLVVLDGPDGAALTMTPLAAVNTAHSLLRAAQEAEQQEGRTHDERDDEYDEKNG